MESSQHECNTRSALQRHARSERAATARRWRSPGPPALWLSSTLLACCSEGPRHSGTQTPRAGRHPTTINNNKCHVLNVKEYSCKCTPRRQKEFYGVLFFTYYYIREVLQYRFTSPGNKYIVSELYITINSPFKGEGNYFTATFCGSAASAQQDLK